MAYNNVPQANQRISDTQSLIQSNFQQIQNAISVNHVPIADVSGNQGKHNLVEFVQQNADPITGATEIDLYTKAVSAVTHLFLRQPNNGTVIDLSLVSTTSAANVTATTFYLMNGLIVQIGFTTSSKLAGDASTTVSFPVSFPNACTSVIFSQLLNNATTAPTNILHTVSYNASSFTVFNRQGTGGFATDISFIAIGN